MIKRYIIRKQENLKSTFYKIAREFGPLREFSFSTSHRPLQTILGYFREIVLESPKIKIVIEAPSSIFYKIEIFWKILGKSTENEIELIQRSL